MCSLKNLFSIECVLYTSMKPHRHPRMGCLQNLFSIECVLYTSMKPHPSLPLLSPSPLSLPSLPPIMKFCWTFNRKIKVFVWRIYFVFSNFRYIYVSRPYSPSISPLLSLSLARCLSILGLEERGEARSRHWNRCVARSWRGGGEKEERKGGREGGRRRDLPRATARSCPFYTTAYHIFLFLTIWSLSFTIIISSWCRIYTTQTNHTTFVLYQTNHTTFVRLFSPICLQSILTGKLPSPPPAFFLPPFSGFFFSC
jgi:hypothetical protein